ncbi:MAG TPA: isochorismate synthase [Solirubrobacteraceae bacterium]|nr:isochorismate synthase [Solirubrobacteraceae bacterium]
MSASSPTGVLRWMTQPAAARLARRVRVALRAARRRGRPALVSVSCPVGSSVDPTAVVCAARKPSDRWFCLEQRDRDGAALAALGSLVALESSGEGRFAVLAARWRALAREALADEAEGPPGSGLVAVGGFAFASDGGASSDWAPFSPASVVVPELSLARLGAAVRLTVNALVAPDDTEADVAGRIERRLAGMAAAATLPLSDPAPVGEHRVFSPLAPAHYEEAVARAVQRIRAGELEKVVLAREVEVHAPAPYDPGALLGLLREAFPSCYVYAVGRGDATFLGATPELLVRCEGQRATTVALAGSSRRSSDPAVDDHLGEQLLRSEKDRQENAIVARRIARALAPHSVWVTVAPEPVVARVANIQHLATPIRAQLAAPVDALELAGRLHPTPAVGAEPAAALELIPALEGIDRGWYAGAVGWCDSSGDGELCVALRCALLRGRRARCYAGCGIVRDSDPADELAETEVKLAAMLAALLP